MHSRSSAETSEDDFEKFNVSRIILHNDFSASTIMNDIAIFVLDRDVIENNSVAPACVTREIYTAGENCVTLGWGNTVQGQLYFNIALQLQQMKLLHNAILQLYTRQKEKGYIYNIAKFVLKFSTLFEYGQ